MKMTTTPVVAAFLCFLLCLVARLPVHGGAATNGTEDGSKLWGYVKVRPQAHMFWLYYKSPQRISTLERPWPTILWIQGGPGVSGVGHGNFLEIGPLDMDLKPRNSTWLQKADLIFVDNPVGVGFSYVEDESALAKTDSQVALDMLELLKALSMEIPTLQSSPLFLVGESYGGKIAAKVGVLLVKAIKAGTLKLKLGGVVLGDSWISPEDHVLSYPWLLQSMSRLDSRAAADVLRMGLTVKQQIVAGQFAAASKTFTTLMYLIDSKSGNVNIEDLRLDATGSTMSLGTWPFFRSETNTTLSDVINGVIKDELNIAKNFTWQEISLKVFDAENNDFMRPGVSEVDDLLSYGVNVTVYNGQFDLICPSVSVEVWMMKLKWSGLQNFLSVPRQPLFYCHPLILTNAFVRRYQNLNFYWILAAGHAVPVDQPCAALNMIGEIVQTPAS